MHSVLSFNMAFQGRIRRNLQLMTVFVLVTSGLDKAAAAPGCPSGLVTILSSYEIQQVQNCETLDGITIKDTIGMKDSLNFPALNDESGGHSTSGGWEGVLKTLSMPKLERVDGPMVMRNLLALSEVNFGKLSTVDGFGIANQRNFPFRPSIQSSRYHRRHLQPKPPSSVSSQPIPSHRSHEGRLKRSIRLFPRRRRWRCLRRCRQARKVGGDLILNWISAISMRSLSSVSGNLEVTEGSSNMSSIALPKLTEIGRSITVRSNANLSSVRLPALSTVSGNIKVGGSINISLPGTLQQFSLPTGSSPQIGGNLQVEGSDSMDCDAIKRSAAMANMNLRDAVSCSTTSSMPEFGNSTHRLPATISSTSLATSKGTANKPSSSGNVGYVVLALLSFTLA
ncbi:hypothetical protein BC829DRAFT_378946 [Chytridium lagenaria]|nr:hypothetical protein BC829DRAFT_378946 [Chytridium lagenaria]